jgi:hypothetical protein
MAGDKLISREHEGYSVARVVRRSRLFFTTPMVITIILTINFFWDVVRENLAAHTLASWPFRFTIIDTATTATVLAVLLSLFMARLQWARSLVPTVGFAIDDEGATFHPDSEIWRLWIYNAGPGGAVIESIKYYVRFHDQPADDGVITWVPLPIINDQLRSRNLVDGRDYFVRWYGNGAPIPAVSKYSEGMQLAWFKIETLAHVRILDTRVRYIDSLGDMHEKTMPMIQRLPSVVTTAIMNKTSRGSSNP